MIETGTEISTRVPEVFGRATATPPGEGVYAWMRTGGGDLVPSGNTGLTPGQAWTYDVNGDLVPTGAAITDDPYWEYNLDGDLVPV